MNQIEKLEIVIKEWEANPDKDDIIADFISGYASTQPPALDEIEGELRMIISHAFLGQDENISRESFNLAIKESAKYFTKLLQPTASLPQSSTEEEKELTTAYLPCREYDEEATGTFTTMDGTGMCHVKEIKVETTYKISKI